ncbi:quaternary amine ABC transporter ATP-binding protein [Segnochrobactrum spirostomi]|uniref:Quaternary amine transport ATP-binding protein n=1 Tax=Segnochrobactrum spirostomi TaxID=2608987 RepID=A0A6A7Y0M2_9HYPH|nr:betaine/proline/choline family ABC transporter ATP-binding protein [Segnochrobactrum spirostomi]MQT12295.1 betaine/proline/choline family ABC transporter ATP-binding protein [Segnochrobactrum spirostomi]
MTRPAAARDALVHSSDQPIRVRLEALTKIFGPSPAAAQTLLDRGASRAEIQKETGCVVGLHDVSFDVREGEILIVMGLSGSGKSTTLRCINRLIEPTSGRVVVDGTDVTGLSERDLLAFRRRKFGMVFQQFALFPHRSILSNVEYGLEIQGTPAAARRDRAMAAIEQVGLKGWETAFPAQLSGGMQQRAGLARALAIDPDILLMDEAFSALDPLIRRDMQGELVALQQRLRKTIVFVSHDLDEAIALGGRIVLMRDGRIVQQGSALSFLVDPADDYVERFVSHIDVLGVLTAADIMEEVPVALAESAGDADIAAAFARTGARFGFLVDAAGRPTASLSAGGAGRAKPHIVRSGETLRSTLGVLARDGHAVAVIDGDGGLIGLLSEHGVVAALAAQHRRTRARQDAAQGPEA